LTYKGYIKLTTIWPYFNFELPEEMIYPNLSLRHLILKDQICSFLYCEVILFTELNCNGFLHWLSKSNIVLSDILYEK
jgi:hypothetical protein